MSIPGYLKDQFASIVLNIFGCMLLSGFLLGAGNRPDVVLMIAGTWAVIAAAFYGVRYALQRKHYHNLMQTVHNLDQKYLIAEIIGEPAGELESVYFHMLKQANKSMLEELRALKDENREYREYIENWVHEIKTPITAVKLIAENNKNAVMRTALTEIERIDAYVEQVMFYARSETVHKDFLIKEIDLRKIIQSVIIRNKHLLLQSGTGLEIAEREIWVYSDTKWIAFILNQILVNAIAYRSGDKPLISIWSEQARNGVYLHIEDNGIGIEADELPRVFDKGFTGTNGRRNKKSTGIGLYLCRKLCGKLEHDITIRSVKDSFTRVSLFFPKGNFHPGCE